MSAPSARAASWRIGRDLSPAARALQRGILAGAQAIRERSLVG
ncbi:hypothetical protein AB7M42_000282 [Bradyrhizobium diazoefficiens]|nr:hypothetical protein [Bradyrhizobium sp. CCBAU 45394]MDK4220345.1 hypothetical protein [Bradyrhizobium diazoefficiens]